MIRVVKPNFKLPENSIAINTTSRSDNWSKGLSPFYLGPVDLYDGYISYNVENAWQYSKVYYNHVDENDNPNEDYFNWAQKGWKRTVADRYPMGKGVKPLYSYWDGKKYSYTEARNKIYIPVYSNAVKDTFAFKKLKQIYIDCKQNNEVLHLIDFDAHNLSHEYDLTYKFDKLWNNSEIKVGHAYVLAMLLGEAI